MPVVTTTKKYFLRLLKNHEKLEERCFDYGLEIEIDEEEIRIEVPANRGDLLCVEHIAYLLNLFERTYKLKSYSIMHSTHIVKIDESVREIRPYALFAVISVDLECIDHYNSIIAFQEKLHNGFGRNRKIASIGLHDVDGIVFPLEYKVVQSSEFSFTPLKTEIPLNAASFLSYVSKQKNLHGYLLSDNQFPCLVMKNGIIASVAPVLNSTETAISTKTKNLLIEVTGTDYGRVQDILIYTVSCLSESIEFIKTTSGQDYPQPSGYPAPQNIEYTFKDEELLKEMGISLPIEEQVALFEAMGYSASVNNELLQVTAPLTRLDILSKIDVLKDCAIAYGFNNVRPVLPNTSTVGSMLRINKISSLLAAELTRCGYVEGINFVLCSHRELSRVSTGSSLVILNPKAEDYQTARQCLVGSLLKFVAHNKTVPLPIRVFEIGECVVETKNRRKLCVMSCGQQEAFEELHGVVDQLMKRLGLVRGDGYDFKVGCTANYIKERCWNIQVGSSKVGILGVLSPEVSSFFDVPFICTCLELDVEEMIEHLNTK